MTDGTFLLDTLPTELLIIIFDYCSVYDLVQLSQVCIRFYKIIRADVLWMKKSNHSLVTNQASERFRERCNPLLCIRNKWRVSHNWEYGRFEKREIFRFRKKMMPSLKLTNSQLWWCAGDLFGSYKRMNTGLELKCEYRLTAQYDFSAFVITKSFLITGDCCGNLSYWKYNNHQIVSNIVGHASDINAMDATSNVIITGSDDKTVKIRNIPQINDRSMFFKCTANINMRDRVWSLATDPTGRKFATGLSGNSLEIPPLYIFDIERRDNCDLMNHAWRRGAGILDIKWENPHTLLTCGYDTYIRKWDLRVGKCVRSWADPTDSTLYCISSDYQHTIISGSQFNSMAVLWDQRRNDYVQLYFMKLPGDASRSPIYSLGFDSSYLYCATDQYLVEMKFSGHPKESFDYKRIHK